MIRTDKYNLIIPLLCIEIKSSGNICGYTSGTLRCPLSGSSKFRAKFENGTLKFGVADPLPPPPISFNLNLGAPFSSNFSPFCSLVSISGRNCRHFEKSLLHLCIYGIEYFPSKFRVVLVQNLQFNLVITLMKYGNNLTGWAH